ncbi:MULTISPECIES: hypothetical protein [unclassified Sphingomonas]|uniref:hypothetical protein n=1 Tax=unclassified Sphingomonas TaxID=196159 RepID=UPI00226AB48A|nr:MULTISPECIES: hypothetical protein [unclassified Sphingomonas]
MDIDALTDTMVTAGKGLASGIWSAMDHYAAPELKKIAVQIEAIADHLPDYTPEGAKILLAMQVNAAVAVIVAMTSLVMLAVQEAINAIIAAVSGIVNKAVGFALI